MSSKISELRSVERSTSDHVGLLVWRVPFGVPIVEKRSVCAFMEPKEFGLRVCGFQSYRILGFSSNVVLVLRKRLCLWIS